MSAENRFGVSEHKSGAGKGIISREKTEYIHDKFIPTEEKSSVGHENTIHSDVSVVSDTTTDSYIITTSLDIDDSIIQHESNSALESDDVINPIDGEPLPSLSPEQITSPISIETAGEVTVSQETVSGLSFLRAEPTSNVFTPGGKVYNLTNQGNQATKNNKHERLSFVSDIETLESSYVGADKTRAYVDFVTAEQELNARGISGTEVLSPVVDILREDETGGEVLADTYLIGADTYKVVKYVKNARQHTTQRETKKAVQSTSKKSVQSANQSVMQAGVADGGKKAVGKTISKAIPPIVWIWVIAGVAVTLIVFMFLGLSSVAYTIMDSTELILIDPETKNATDIVNWCKWAEANSHGYVYGGFGQMCTPEYLDQQAARYPGNDEAGGECREIGNQWIGKPVYDCIGIIKAYMWYDYEDDEIYYQTNGFPDCSASTIWDFIERGKSGTIDTIPEIPGIAVWMDGHIGVYIGNGEVIEAQGVRTGVVKTQLDNGSWTHWLYIPHLDYGEFATEPTT